MSESNGKSVGRVIAVVVAVLVVLGLAVFFVARGRSDGKLPNMTTTNPSNHSSDHSSSNGSTNNTDHSSTGPNNIEPMVDKGEIGTHYVEIKDYRLVKEENGKDAILITYSVKNNGTAAANFLTVLEDKVYQGDEKLHDAVLKNVENYDVNSIRTNIEKGATHDVHRAFVLKDVNTPVKIDIKQLGALDGGVVTKMFEIKK